jgi:hypothetical protein
LTENWQAAKKAEQKPAYPIVHTPLLIVREPIRFRAHIPA